MELVTIYGVPLGKFCLRALSCFLCILWCALAQNKDICLYSVALVIIKEEKLLNFQVTDSFLYFKHLLYNIFVHALNILHTVV